MTAVAVDPASRFSVIDARGSVDTDAAEAAVRDLLRALGRDPRGEHLMGTPRRVVAAYAELQVQERLTQQVANWLSETLGAQGRRRGTRGRIPVHVTARRDGERLTHADVGAGRFAA